MTRKVPFRPARSQRPPVLRAGEVSELTTNRISVYLRCLESLASEGISTISSQRLAERFHLNSAQIRKDLANFGEFGIRGVGYDIDRLRETIIRILGLDRERPIVIVGAGNLGLALADSSRFNSGGFRVAALCDRDPARVGTRSRSGVPVIGVDELPGFVAREGIEIGVLAVPDAAAADGWNQLCAAGIAAVLNFSPVRIDPRPGVRIKNVDLKISLEALSFHLSRKRLSKRAPPASEGEGRE